MSEKFFEEQREQSQIKGEIVAKYFDAWARIITATQRRHSSPDQVIAYIDLFSGPGRYKDGAASTPLMVLEKAIENPQYRKRLVTFFNDKDPEHANNLRREIASLPGIDTLAHAPVVENEDVGEALVEEWEKMKTVPVLAFIDPWGYKGLSLRLIEAFLDDWGCDCIVFFNYTRINMGLSNPYVREHMAALFGEERASRLAKELAGADPAEREAMIVEELAAALKGYGSTQFVLPFCFKNERGTRTTHHLVFVTKHFKGYEVMREIMAKASSEEHQGVASFFYCPAPSSRQQILFDLNRPLDDLGGLLLEAYAGRRAKMVDLYEEHSVGRPYTKKNYKDVLRALEDSAKITTSSRKSSRGFADDLTAIFPAK